MKMEKGRMTGIWVTIIMLFCFGLSVGYQRELTHRAYMEHSAPMEPRWRDTCLNHMRLAARSGYNAMLFTGPFGLDKVEKWSSKNVVGWQTVKAEGKKLGLSVVVPYASAIMGAHSNPMLAETAPARNTPFKVANGMAKCVSDHKVGLVNGGFESFSGSTPSGWQQRNLVGSLSRDGANKHSGASSLRATNMKSGAYINQDITVKPDRIYRISAWFKTASLPTFRDVEFVVKGKHELLNRRWRPFGTRKQWTKFSLNMNWTKCTADFASLNNSKVNLAFWFAGIGYGTGSGGTIWIDDLVVEEVGLYETIRRDDCPIVVKSADGSKTYKEGTDYTVDPRCSKFTDNSHYYEGHLKIPAGSSIQNGQTLKVNWYKYADNYLLYSETNFCIPESFEAMKDDAKRIDELVGQSKWSFLAHDEWRSAFQSDRCPLFPKARTAGQYMAGAMGKTVETLRSVNNAKRELWLYNDMYDPFHNAVNPYSMCVGGNDKSWVGLDPSVIIINWRHLATSYSFFMGLDSRRKGIVNRQLILCQGGEEVPGKVNTIKSLEARGGKGVIGMVWVTWYNRWFHMTRTADAFKRAGWWGNKPLPDPGYKPPAIKSVPAAASETSLGLKVNAGSGMSVVEFNLPYHSKVDLRVVDMQGRIVRKLTGLAGKAGRNRVKWDGERIPAGVYLLRLRTDHQSTRQLKLVVM